MDHETPPPELAEYRWKRRLLLLFAPDRNHPAYLEQRRLLEGHEAALKDRDLLVLDVGAGLKCGGGPQLQPREVARLRERYGVPADEFGVLLVGKDGTLKRREAKAVPLPDLFEQIDGMPMRIRELRDR